MHQLAELCEIGSERECPSAHRLRLRAEERVNCVTHGVGLVLSVCSVALLALAVTQRGDAWQLVGCAIYSSTLVAVYAASTLSHVFERPRPRRFFRIVDQAFIFLLIAGTYTPVALTYLRGAPWWILFGLVWGVALAGFVSKAVLRHRLDAVSSIFPVLLGWMPALAVKPMLGLMPGLLVVWMLMGGLFYTAGTIFLWRDEKVPFFHGIWHVFVMAGSACHYVGILFYCTAAPL